MAEEHCPECGAEFETVWRVSVGTNMHGYTQVFDEPGVVDVGRCNNCNISFESVHGGPWHRQGDEVRDDPHRRLCRWFLAFGGPGRAAIGGTGAFIAAVILLVQGDVGPGIGFAILSAWCAFAYRVTTRCLRNRV